MRILSRLFLRSYLTYLVMVFVIAMVVVVLVEMALNSELMFTENGEGGGLAYLVLRLVSYYFPLLVPVASFAGSLLAIGLAARAHEMLACKTAGVSPYRIAVPVLVAAALLAGGTLVMNETIVLDAGQRYDRLERGDEAEGPLFRAGSFWHRQGDTLYNVSDADREARTIYGVRVYERDRQGRLVRSIRADRAVVDTDGRWHLHGATIRHFDPKAPESAPQTTRHEEMELAISSDRELALLEADPEKLSLLDLRELIAALERDGRNPARYRARFHARLAEPLTVLLFALLGIPLGLAVERTGSLAVAGLQGVGLIGLFWMLHRAADVLASGGVPHAAVAPWAILVGFSGWGTWRLLRAPV